MHKRILSERYGINNTPNSSRGPLKIIKMKNHLKTEMLLIGLAVMFFIFRTNNRSLPTHTHTNKQTKKQKNVKFKNLQDLRVV